MPLDETLPASSLSPNPTVQQIAGHFLKNYGVRVDGEGFNALSPAQRLSLSGARLPEPPEAHLLDRSFQVVPNGMLQTVRRIVLLETGFVGRYGSYQDGIVRIIDSPLLLREGDPDFGKNYSFFVTTVLHEIGHAVFERWLTSAQQGAVEESYLSQMVEAEELGSDVEATQRGVEHYFINNACNTRSRSAKSVASTVQRWFTRQTRAE